MTLLIEIWETSFKIEYEFIPGYRETNDYPSENDHVSILEVYLMDPVTDKVVEVDILPILNAKFKEMIENEIKLEHGNKFDDWEDYKDD